jgi:hypothetical protein
MSTRSNGPFLPQHSSDQFIKLQTASMDNLIDPAQDCNQRAKASSSVNLPIRRQWTSPTASLKQETGGRSVWQK